MLTLNPLPHDVSVYLTAQGMAEGFQFVVMARRPAPRAWPGRPHALGRRRPVTVRPCKKWMPMIYTGTHCVLS